MIFVFAFIYLFSFTEKFAGVRRRYSVLYCTVIYRSTTRLHVVPAHTAVTADTAVPPALLCLRDYIPKVYMAYRTHLHGDLGGQATLINAHLPPSSSLLIVTCNETPHCRSLSRAHPHRHTCLHFKHSRIIIHVVPCEKCFDVQGCIVLCIVVLRVGGDRKMSVGMLNHVNRMKVSNTMLEHMLYFTTD